MLRENEFVDEIGQYAGRVRQEQEKLLSALTAIPAPSGQEDARADFCLNYLRALGFSQAYTDEAGNVIVEIGGRDASLPVHFFAAHLDTVFPDTDPIPVTMTADRISAPGVGDDTANAVSLLLILRYLAENPVIPVRNTVFVWDTCEEGLGNLAGCRSIMQKYAGRCGQFVSLDMGYDAGTDLAVGSRRWRITLRAGGGHSYWDFGKENAIARAADLIAMLYAVNTDTLPGRVTYNVGQISGGTSVNTIAQEASFLYEFRADSAAGLEKMNRVFLRTLAEFAGDGFACGARIQPCEGLTDVWIETEQIGDRPGMGKVDPDAMEALRSRVSKAVSRRTGAAIRFDSGSTDCNIPLSMGIPSICFGTWLGAGAHSRQEYVERASLTPGLAAALDFILEDMQM